MRIQCSGFRAQGLGFRVARESVEGEVAVVGAGLQAVALRLRGESVGFCGPGFLSLLLYIYIYIYIYSYIYMYILTCIYLHIYI